MSKMNIPDNSLVVVPSNEKKKFLRKLNKSTFINVKVMTIKELRDKYYFSYNDETIYYLMKKYNYNYDVAVMYLSNLMFVDSNDFGIDKVRKIIDLKNELIKERLLNITTSFKSYLVSKKVILYNCKYLSKFDNKMINKIEEITSVEKVFDNENTYSDHSINQFNTISEEVNFIAGTICDLVSNKIDINNIKLCYVDDEYSGVVKRIFNWYNIPITFQDNYLYNTKLGQDFLKYLDDDINVTLDYIKNNYDLNNNNILELYNKIVQILNKYVWADSYKEVRSFIEKELKSTIVNNISYINEVKVINSIDEADDNDYVFLMGFNQGDIPKNYKDEDYFNDEIKNLLELDTAFDLNKKSYNKWLDDIRGFKNLIITTKLNNSSGECYLSSLNDDLCFEIKKPKIKYNYSNLYNKLLLGEKLDSFIKYGEKSTDLELLFSNYHEIEYRSYSNVYKGIDKLKLREYLNNKLVLSYSAMNTYYQCGFRYYLSNILKLNIFEETFYTILGSLFHYILSIALESEIDLDYYYDKYLSTCTYNFNSRELFFLSNLKKDLAFIIETIKIQNESNSLKNTYYEEKVEIDKSRDNMKIIFKGYIDKLMTNDDETIVSIVDYKTGNPDLNLNHIIYGLDLQLPVYVYLAKDKFKNAKFAGFYLQKILNNEISKDYKNTYLELKKEKLKLQGYSNSNIDILKEFDNNYTSSKVIKSMKINAKGDIASKKILNDFEIDKLSSITDDRVEEAIDGIMNAKLDINPKRINMDNLGCKYCSFRDICFVKEDNIVNLKEYDYKDFLKGGVDNDTN